MQNTETPLQLRLWTVEEYHRMAEAGILQPDERVELIAGQIVKKMSPQGTPHATTITLTRLLLENRLRDLALLVEGLECLSADTKLDAAVCVRTSVTFIQYRLKDMKLR